MATTIQQIELPKKARAVDTSGNNNHGQIYSGRGLEFDGVSDNLTTGSDIEGVNKFSDGTAWTITLWVYFTGSASEWYVGEDGGSYTMLIKESSGALRFREVTGGAFHYFNSTNPINLNTWYRQTVVCDGTTVTCYLNGEIWGSAITPDSTLMYFTNIGMPYETAGVRSKALSGMMSDFQVWDTLWSAADVTYDYLNPESLALNNSGTALTESNLKLWYPMQDGHRGQQSYILDGANTGAVVELVTNGGFDTGITGWTAAGGWSYGDQEAEADGTTSTANMLYQDCGLIAGNTYTVSFSSNRVSGALFVKDGSTYSATTLYTLNTGTGPVVHEFNITKGSGSTLGFYAYSYGGSIDNVSVKAINDKHHATTVFYGDELVTNGTFAADSDWTKGGGWTIGSGVASRASESTNSAIIQPIAIITGRTYEVKYDRTYASGGGETNLYSEFITAGSHTTLGSLTSTTVETVTVTDTFTPAYSGNMSLKVYGIGTYTGTIDNVSVKEIGVASGWTDADQQLHIPQTALQSYNELAWFDGTSASNGYMDLDTQIATTDNDWSLSFWVIRQDTPETSYFIMGNEANKFIALNTATDKLHYRDGNGTYHAISDSGIPYNEWTHVVVTATADTSVLAYVNGVAQTANSNMSDTEIVLKKFMIWISAAHGTLGSINEISYYSDVLTAAEALDLFNDGKAKSALEASGSAGLVGYWRNNGLSEWKDLKGSNDGNTSAGVVETILIPQGVDSTRDAQGFIMNKQKSTSCLNLDGIGYVSLPTTGVVTDDFSFEAWAKAESWTSGESVIMEVGASMLLFGNNHGYIRAVDGTFTNQLPSHSFVVGNWYHIVVTRIRNGNQIMYVDGVAKNTVTAPDTAMTLSDTTIGKDNTTRVSRDALDGVHLYSKALSAGEVLRNYKATKGNHRN